MEVIDDILVSGSEIDRKALQKLHKLTDTQMELLTYYAGMRRTIHVQSEQALDHRRKEHPKATQEELDLGIYLEALEPQVRQAVLTLYRKGYSSYESGFYGAGELQTIGLNGSPLEGFLLPKNLTQDPRVLEWKMTHNQISFFPERNLTLEDLTEIWNAIADAFPALDEPSEPTTLPGAVHFREQQKTLR